jgi:hypothetical protein
VQLFARNIHEQTPGLVITDRSRHTVFGRGAEPSFSAPRRQCEQALAHGGRNIRFDMVRQPAESAHQRASPDPFEVISGLVPVEAPTRGSENGGDLAHASGERRVIDAVDGRLFAVGNHHFVAKHIDQLESEELALRLIDDPDPRFANGARPQPPRRDNKDHVALLRRQPIMRGGSGEAEVVPTRNAAGQGKQVAVAQGVRPLLGWDKEILSPACPFEPALVAQRFNDMVGRLGGCAEQFDDFRSRRLPSATLAEGKYDSTFLGR